MATVANRSRFTVTVARRPDLARTFPYAAELKGRGLAPRLARLDDRFEVKIRHKTGPDQCLTVGSYEEADLVVKQIESERRRGLFIDYTLGWKTRFADLLRRKSR